MKYIVWFSWWVDSSYIWWYLKSLWHDVLLVNLKNTIWNNKCCELPTKLFDIAKNLWLNLEVVDVTEDFKRYVIEDFIQTYSSWKTPNPCVNCNELVRFKILDKIREKYGYDKVTTGHYAKIVDIDWQSYLSRPMDEKKDQTYMIYRISNIFNDKHRILNSTDFVLSGITKEEMKKIYEQHIWPITARESQNICFIPDDDHPRYIKQNVNYPIYPWKIFDTNWNYLWEHKWVIYYTIWQRCGLNINSNEKLYVVEINHKENSLVLWKEENLLKEVVNLEKIFIHKELLEKSWKVYWKIRYHHKLEEIEQISILEAGINLKFINPIRAITPWQHCVLYKEIQWNTVVIWWWTII